MNTTTVSFLGASPATSNLGVSALFATMVAGVHRRMPDADLGVFDTLLGIRDRPQRLDEGDPIPVRFLGVRHGRRYHRWENLKQMSLAARLGSLGDRLNPGVCQIRRSAAVLDVSGGDSFTDMYPDDRIDLVAGVKELVLRIGTPLLLLPQTYGPFDESQGRAAGIVRAARACWARDQRSFEILKQLLGDRFDPARHRCGVDMAFGLAVLEPPAEELAGFGPWLESHPRRIGINVSGLMYNDPAKTRAKYGFKADYRDVIARFVEWCLDETDEAICLVPHVMCPPPLEESDPMACEHVREIFRSHGDRVIVSPTSLDQSEVKWVVSRMDWFCGTRMHATIAGLSTCTPTATVSYSNKALGVFESCGQGGEVFDPRKMDTDEVVAAMIDSYRRRETLRGSLERHVPDVKAKAASQMDEIADTIGECLRERSASGRP